MENPASWDLLVASVAACDLSQPDAAWKFLVHEQLVRDAPGDRESFVDFVREEIDRGPITGPSVARRVAGALEGAGIALPAGMKPDPFGKMARERRKHFPG